MRGRVFDQGNEADAMMLLFGSCSEQLGVLTQSEGFAHCVYRALRVDDCSRDVVVKGVLEK